jgi:hypothetical protein
MSKKGPAPNTVQAKLLLGWMTDHEALQVLRSCVFEKPLGRKKALAIWRGYRDKVLALEPRRPEPIKPLELTDIEKQAVEEHVKRLKTIPNGKYFTEVVKIHPGNILAKQFHVLTERSADYAKQMSSDTSRTNHFFGVDLDHKGPLEVKQRNQNLTCVRLPHPEYVVLVNSKGFEFRERDRYVLLVKTPDDRFLLWGGYHRTHAVLCHIAGDAAGVAPVLTVMAGIPEVEDFFKNPSPTRDVVLGDRPALLRDFLDENLFMTVNLRKRRAEGRIEKIGPTQFRAGVLMLNDDE